MKTKLNRSFAVIMLLVLALTGCRTSRTVSESPIRRTRKQQSVQLIPLAQYPSDVKTVTAKTSISIDYNGIPATVKGRLRMYRDEVVQLSITAFGLMEIASIEFTPEAAYIIDKVNKRYALLDYSSGWMNYAGISFSTVQALFWNRLFIPGESEAWNHTEEFTVIDAITQRLIEPNRQRMLKCQFYTDTDCKQLNQTDLAMQQYAATWKYGQFNTLDTYTYPAIHDVSVNGASRALSARISLAGVSTLDTAGSVTTDLSRYKESDFEELLSIFNMIR